MVCCCEQYVQYEQQQLLLIRFALCEGDDGDEDAACNAAVMLVIFAPMFKHDPLGFIT